MMNAMLTGMTRLVWAMVFLGWAFVGTAMSDESMNPTEGSLTSEVESSRETTSPATNPADPEAIPAARQLLTYLAGLDSRADHRLITGETIWRDQVANHDAAVNRTARPPIDYSLPEQTYNLTGQWPGMIGFGTAIDPAADDGAVGTFIQDYWDKGGILSAWNHVANVPEKKFGLPLSQSYMTDNLTAILEDPDYLAELDRQVSAFLYWQARGVVFLVRSFGEMNGKWNWYYTANYDNFKALWVHYFHYMTSRGVHNQLHVYCPDAYDTEPTFLERYPGDQYVDLVCLDSYRDLGEQPFQDGAAIPGYAEMVSTGKPLMIGEYGAYSTSVFEYLHKDATYLIEGLKANMPKIILLEHSSVPWNIASMTNPGAYMNDAWVQNRPVPWNQSPMNAESAGKPPLQ